MLRFLTMFFMIYVDGYIALYVLFLLYSQEELVLISQEDPIIQLHVILSQEGQE